MNWLKKNIFPGLMGLLIIFLFSAPLVFSQEAAESAAESHPKYPRFGLPQNESVLAQGKKVYQTYCIGCHGAQGDGKGPAAVFLNPKPRNFQDAEFRFSSRASGDLPTDQDLFRTVTEGLHGSSMPSWKFVPENDRWAVIAYLKAFAPEKWKAEPGLANAIADDPFFGQPREAAIKRGETAYHGMAMCYSCHAAFIAPEKINEARASYGMPPLKGFRKDLGRSQVLKTNDGSVITPPDFTWNKLKRGTELRTLYHVIGNGITGTPMPTWKGVLPEEDLWGIVYYVQSLAEKRPSLVTETDIRSHEAGVEAIEQARVKFEDDMKNRDAEVLKQSGTQKETAIKETASPLPVSTKPSEPKS